MKTLTFKNHSEFLAREDKTINGVSPEFLEMFPDAVAKNENNIIRIRGDGHLFQVV